MRFFSSNRLKNLLDILYFSGISKLLKPVSQGNGIILTLHHVMPSDPNEKNGFNPNGLLEVTPHFLAQTIEYLQNNGYEIISLDAAQKRIVNPTKINQNQKPFVVFTLDDGYLDNLRHAYPVFKKYNCPFTIFVTTDLCDHTLFMWWRALEAVVRDNAAIKLSSNGININAETITAKQKTSAYNDIYWQLRNMGEFEKRQAVLVLSEQYNFDPIAETQKVCDELGANRNSRKRPLGHYWCTHHRSFCVI